MLPNAPVATLEMLMRTAAMVIEFIATAVQYFYGGRVELVGKFSCSSHNLPKPHRPTILIELGAPPRSIAHHAPLDVEVQGRRGAIAPLLSVKRMSTSPDRPATALRDPASAAYERV